jgi:hypothetical protein
MSFQPENTRLKGPLIVDYDGDMADPAAVADVPEMASARALQTVSVLASPKRSAFGRFAFWVFSSLFGLIHPWLDCLWAVCAGVVGFVDHGNLRTYGVFAHGPD